METSNEVGELFAALAKAQAEIRDAAKDSKSNRNAYASLHSVLQVVRPALSAHGLTILQSPEETERGVVVSTLIGHGSGQWLRSSIGSAVASGGGISGVQALGSTITYLRRYSLMALVGIAPEDDDGQSAVQATSAPQTRAPQANPMDVLNDALRVVGLALGDVQEWARRHGEPDPQKEPIEAAKWLRGAGAATVRGFLAARAAESSEEEPDPEVGRGMNDEPPAYHPSFDEAERTRFHAAIGGSLRNIKQGRPTAPTWDDVKAYLDAHKMPHPGTLDDARRGRFVTWLTGDGDGVHEVEEWLAKRDEGAA